MSNKNVWNPRFLLYCAAKGFKDDPEGMKKHDSKKYEKQGTGFVVWLNKMMKSYRIEKRIDPLAIPKYNEFNKWLERKVL
jgi:hypothetical protein